MGQQTHEYDVVQLLPGFLAQRATLNGYAALGWRVVAVNDYFAYLERPLAGATEELRSQIRAGAMPRLP